MLDKHVLPLRSKRQGPPQHPPLAGSLQVSPFHLQMTAAGRYFWFGGRQRILKIIEKSSWVGFVEDGGDTLKEGKLCGQSEVMSSLTGGIRAEKQRRNSESRTHSVYFYEAVSS